MRNSIRTCFGTGLVLLFSIAGFAQESASSASVSRSRAMANSGNPGSYRSQPQFVAPDEVRVEEFVNYHRHRLPLPKAGQSVAVETRWGNDQVSRNHQEAVLQIGFTTDFANEKRDLPPLNLSLVIDMSGSMAAEDKMSRVKESLRAMIGQLREDDIVSIVAFESEARVLCSAARVGNGYSLLRAIDSIRPGGGTNLHAGLMLGYKESQRNYKKDGTNRVILLTDGIANVGTTEPNRIAMESSEYNSSGIDLSTIGVGLELDRELLRTLSTQGRGLFHFVADSQDIEKVFVKEVQSLISPVARKVTLDVEFGRDLDLEKVFGYSPQMGQNKVSIPIDDMNSGLTQIVLMKFRVHSKGMPVRNIPVKVKLSYFDIASRWQKEERQVAMLYFKDDSKSDLLADSEVRKNYTIAELAQSLFEMTEAVQRNEYRTAETLVGSAIRNTGARYPNMQDPDIRFIFDIVRDYERNLITYNRGNSLRNDCDRCD